MGCAVRNCHDQTTTAFSATSNRFLCHTTCGTRQARRAFPSGTHETGKEKPLRKQLLILASFALIINSGVTLAQPETPQQDDSGAPSGLRANTGAPETTGQAPNFEDRWSAQRETPDRLPTATLPGAGAPRTTDQAPRPLLDQGNGNWDPPPINAPTTQR